jgi:8-oxo-dGTP diphosphatase
MRADRSGDEHGADFRVTLVISRFQVVPSAYLIFRRTVEEGDQVLLMLRAGTGYMDGHWATVAGHVEAGESCAAAAVREAREELEPDRAAALAWFGLGSLPTPVVPHEDRVLTNLTNGRVPAILTYGFADA